LLEHLQEQKPDQDWSLLKRTLQRRVQHWKALHGPAPEVMVPLAYQPGEIGFCDFTRVKRVVITLCGQPFPHLLFHDRLAWSGWAYGQLIHGGESFVALSEGLQNGLAACGGVPKELRTDRLSAASRNRDGSYALDIITRYQALCAHYGLSSSRNNRGVAHENGIVEAPHGHVKRRLEQKLILRGSCDFEEPAEYGELLAEVFSALNAPRQRRYEQELGHLAPLPAFSFADYERLTVRVRSTSTIEVRQGGVPGDRLAAVHPDRSPGHGAAAPRPAGGLSGQRLGLPAPARLWRGRCHAIFAFGPPGASMPQQSQPD
jgi:hypothetical protein